MESTSAAVEGEESHQGQAANPMGMRATLTCTWIQRSIHTGSKQGNRNDSVKTQLTAGCPTGKAWPA